MKPDDIEKKCIPDALKIYEEEVSSWRQQKIREWRRHHFYWEGMNNIWWSSVSEDWRHAGNISIYDLEEYGSEDEDRTINIFEAHGRSIIAALSSSIPGVRFFPSDAKNSKDLLTSQVYSKIADILSKQNNFPLLFAKALFLLFNEDYIASHVYNEAKYEYGSTFDEKTSPEGELIEYIEEPKSKTKIDVFGAMHVVIPPFIRHQSETPFLVLKSVLHKSQVVDIYAQDDEELRDLIMNSSRRYDEEDQYTHFNEDLAEENQTLLKEVWLRPWALWILGKEKNDDIEMLRQKYPKGIKATLINLDVIDIEESNLDDSWEITADPLSEYLIGRALGKNLVPIQDMTNDLNDLTIQTIAHGIPTQYADPAVVDFDAIEERDNAPGMVYPASPPMGHRLQESFHTSDKSTLSREVAAFNQYLNYSGQFVSGDFPSVHGAALEGGSRTASEYHSSRQNALQRLSIIYKSMGEWVAMTKKKGVMNYVDNLKEDELFVDYKDGAFFNIWIRMQQMTGQIGRTEPIISEVFPNTPAQIRELLISMMEMKSPVFDQIIQDPNNLHLLNKSLGLVDLHIPGENDRSKQWAEIAMLIEQAPIDLDGQPLPSIQIQVEIDDHMIEAQICLDFLKSGEGQLLKEINPNGYLNVLLHFMQHKLIVDQQVMMQQQQEEMANERGSGSPGGSS